jgi:IS30 family transposase
MVNKLTHRIRPGGLSMLDHARIFELADKGWKAQRIARAIEKHPSTVQWFMYRHGLMAPKYNDREPYLRNGRQVTPFTEREDDFIESLRTEGVGPSEIAERVNRMFATQRSKHTIQCRLVMLSAREVA